MSLPVQRRWLVLGGLLTATLAAAAWVHERGEDDVVAAAERVRVPKADARANAAPSSQRAGARLVRQEAARQQVPQVRLDKLDARQLGEASSDPFAAPVTRVKRTRPEPRPVIVARPVPAPPPPSAPPLPFRYMGKMVSVDGVSVFLVHRNRNLVVHEGDTIDAKYRVDRIGEAAMTLTYLPLGQRQSLPFGESR